MTRQGLRKYFEYENGCFRRRVSANKWPAGLLVSGSKRSDGYLGIYFNGRVFLAHRMVYTWHSGNIPKDKEVDHINGNRADNRIENLRLANRSQNIASLHSPPKNRSGVKGLHFRRGRWVGQVAFRGKRFEVSSKNKNIAIEKLRNLREELHGEFAQH